MPKPFRKEFEEDVDNVIRVYRDSAASLARVAKDFGISASCLKRWLVIDDRKSTSRSAVGQVANESDTLREANKRVKLLEQENEVLRRAAAHLSQAHLPGNRLPARPRAGRRRYSRCGDVPGPQDGPPALLPLAPVRGHHRRADDCLPRQRVVRRSPR